MSIKLTRKSNTMTISSFHEGFLLNKFNMDPEYQRKSIWSAEQQSLLIDSILKNIPIPPVFLREFIDKDGKTQYEVIDGKQRLTAIIDFINGEVDTSDDLDDPLYDENIAGVNFLTLKSDEFFEDYLDDFWSYPIPIEYIKTKDDSVVDRIFDRLNRSGEKLSGQELRQASYYNSKLIQLAYKLSKHKYWSRVLCSTDKQRMEDIELISEFIFLIIEGKELNSTDKELDILYKKYARNTKDVQWSNVENKFNEITEFLVSLDLDLDLLRISGVSHLYGLFSFSYHCLLKDKTYDQVKSKVHDFYKIYKNKNFNDNSCQSEYKKSMQNSTRGKSQRRRRRQALQDYCS
ncbi:hypothetical protein CSW98_12550 [Vibrio sp. HA2012]|uniref:DUF262 domain-containing protein n=1 Tax=Vibrio sp. HA2012 TaxID=1971595 RepID=UPI000C2CE26F|nr:DUF262 domain-containing protein [Vibrio sp. HA2012]PJC85878.1 hypothetical protein CSW98_12550 [Vibrio sp. HA2012]